MEVIQQLIGRLHPIVVHLPIGFIITALLLQWIDRKENKQEEVIAQVFLWGFIAATIACISGYLLYIGEGYSFDTVKIHLWVGIATALFSGLMYLRVKENSKVEFLQRIPKIILSFSLLFLISMTGHLGGSITHGSDYLLEPLPTSIKIALGFKVNSYEMPKLEEASWEESNFYNQVIQPILNNKCLSCHSPNKSKGDLQLNDAEGILKGGENGDVIIPKDAKNSPLYARLILPQDHEDHMPPKEKTQLSKEEIEVIKAWIETGSSLDKNIGELELKKHLFTSFFRKENTSEYPDVKVEAIPEDTIKAIRKHGFHIEPISESNNLIRVSCINMPSFSDDDIKLLNSVKQQIVYLDLGSTEVTDAIFEHIATFPHLTTLNLSHTNITGKNIEKLAPLEHLRTLNLTHSKFNGEHLSNITSFKHLKNLFLFNSLVKQPESKNEDLPNGLNIDYGNYHLPKIATDTIVF
ncbi:c-type cytochrome domain-containing protein [Arenibacter latericius]|uniref:c-type cytochrome domain-containing protein n=1 Tax=Arenibacter latericius TaxID=86104 RepID=UPI0004171D13|nr:c-type cytochrome domain-containing protein [Arenibacter latericius]